MHVQQEQPSSSSSGSRPANFVQLVDGEGKFSESLDSFVGQTNMRGKGDNYNILSVFGPQSSGKSTLLNRLFGAGFPTMDASAGRYQVTLGVCMAKANKTLEKDILLMDLEGTDSKERGSGDDNMAFERKISLFALAISEVLLVNMWMQDIGRYNAANLSLLRIVFELNLQLFTKDKASKTLLLFIIRDHIREMTPLEALRDQMIKDIEKIWDSIMKPKQFEDSKVTDFFDFEFTSLPHKILKESLFDEEIELLRDRFVNPNAEGYVFNPKYKKSVPIDDFEMYAKDIWEVIYANKDLDIPTQKEMLAMYRCDEISSALYRSFEEHVIEWTEILKKKQLVSKFGNKSHEVIEKILVDFMDQTKLYVPDVVHKKCEEFKERMISEVAILFTSQIALVKQQSLDSFKKYMFSNVQKKIDDNEIVDDFTNTTKQTHDYVTNFFIGLAEESIYPGMSADEQFNHKPSLESLEEEIKNIIEEYRHKQVEVIVKIQIDEMKKHIREDINQWVTKPNEKLWVTLSNYLNTVVTEEKEHLAKSLKDLDIADCSKFVPRIRVAARNEIVTKVREMSNVISLTLTSRFEDLFKRDENNILRTWKNMEQIKEDYTRARQEAIKILDIFFLCRLDYREFDNIHLRLPRLDESGGIGDFAFPASDDIQKALKNIKLEESSASGDEGNEVVKKDVMSLFEENLIMSENICIRAYENYIMRTDNIYGDVQRAQLIAQQNKANIPYWVYILLVVLGWDEIYSVIKNPLYLILILIVVVIIFQTWLKSKVQELIEDPETNPTVAFALQMAQVHIFPYLAMANVERMIPPPATVAHSTTATTTSSTSNVSSSSSESSSESTVRQRSQVKKAKMENQISLHQHDE